MTAEMRRLVPEPVSCKLTTGHEVVLKPLRAREFFRLLRIITRGAGSLLMTLKMSKDPDEFVGQLVAILIFAIPEAEQETINFIRSLVKVPVPADDSKEAKDQADKHQKELYAYLDNPEIEDMIIIIETVLSAEKEDLHSLGKRLQGLFNLTTQTNLAPVEDLPTDGWTEPPQSKKPTESSLEDGQEPST